MIKKRWRFAVALAAASLLATGCSGSTSESDGPVTLTYWDFLDPSQDNPRAKALKERFQASAVGSRACSRSTSRYSRAPRKSRCRQ